MQGPSGCRLHEFPRLEAWWGQERSALELRPNVNESALREQSCKACILCHAAQGASAPKTWEKENTYDEFEVFGERKPHGGEHTLERIIGIIDPDNKSGNVHQKFRAMAYAANKSGLSR